MVIVGQKLLKSLIFSRKQFHYIVDVVSNWWHSLGICEDPQPDQIPSHSPPKNHLFSYKCDAVQYISLWVLNSVVSINSTSIWHSLQSDFSSISGIILLLLVANAPVHFRKKRKKRNQRWRYQLQYNLLPCFCLSLPADWTLLFVIDPMWISNHVFSTDLTVVEVNI